MGGGWDGVEWSGVARKRSRPHLELLPQRGLPVAQREHFVSGELGQAALAAQLGLDPLQLSVLRRLLARRGVHGCACVGARAVINWLVGIGAGAFTLPN
eukprot:SAG31_NODE_38_length_31498_cov_41.930539_7_plen_99_part_00